MKRFLYLIALPALLLFLLAGYGFLSHTQAAEKPPADKMQAVPVKVAQAVREDIPVQLHVLGTAVPYQSVSVSARIDSQITKVNFRDGDTVKKGDLLFTLDDRTIKANLNQAKADLARDQAQVETLKKDYERNRTLIAQKAISQQALEQSKAALDAQLAAVAASKATVESNEVLLDYTVIKAPIDGRTGIVNVTEGNNVKANDAAPLVTINQIRPIQVRVSLPQDSFDSIRNAMTAGIVPVKASRSAEGSKDAFGTLAHIDNNIDQTSGTFIARAVFANESEQLWPGMLVNLTIDIGKDKQAVVVPEVAIQTGPAGQFVFVVVDNKAKKTAIKLDRIQDGMALISEGITEQDSVAVDGIMALKDGVTVKVSTGDDKIDQNQVTP